MLRSRMTPRALAGLRAYEYVSSGYTWLDYAHVPFWEWATNKLPLTLAPNLITLAGTLCIAVAYALNIGYNPSFTGEAPAWVQWLTALSVALYVNLDCMDGKQARRTGSSSPLGQLFDHGCDALALHMMLANIAAALGVGCGWKMAAGCLGIMLPWMLAQWEEYHTGVMMYGNKYYGVLEANYSICAVHVLSALFGLHLWRSRLPLPSLLTRALALSGLAPSLAWQRTASVADVALVLVSLAGLLQGLTNVIRVFSCQEQLQFKRAGYKQLGPVAATLHLAGLLTTMGLGAWSVASAHAPVTHVPADGGSPAGPLPHWLTCATPACECRHAYSMFGLLYALTATQLIISHMAKEPWAPSLLPLAFPLLHVASLRWEWLGIAAPQSAVLLLHSVAALSYSRYVMDTISQICDNLGIACFRIPPVPKHVKDVK